MNLRLNEAEFLLDQKNDWASAYYLAGYAVEFALKVRIIIQLMKSDSFPERKLAESFYKHDLTILIRAAGPEDELSQDAAVSAKWLAVKDWSEQSRYDVSTTEQKARELLEAIKSEVLPWIKARW